MAAVESQRTNFESPDSRDNGISNSFYGAHRSKYYGEYVKSDRKIKAKK
jgi:hypothetical protein